MGESLGCQVESIPDLRLWGVLTLCVLLTAIGLF